MNKRLLLLIIGLAGIFLLWKVYDLSTQQDDFKIERREKKKPDNTITTGKEEVIDRNTTRFIYTKHARCRMDCRHIDESEVKEILKEGTINYHKSQYEHTDNPKYALEGWSHDKQHLRIVFAPTEDALVVVTCIDLENEFECHCPGDEHKN